MHTINHQKILKTIKKFSKAKILVVGDVMLDEFIWGKVTRISPEAPVPVVNVHHETSMPGGAANVARNIRALNGKVILASAVGDDTWGNLLFKLLKEDKVDTSILIKLKNRSTILKTRVIAHSQQVVRIDKEKNSKPKDGELAYLNDNIKKVIKNIDGVIVEDYGKGLINQDLVYFLADICKQHNKFIIADPKKGHAIDYTDFTLITPNLEEALALAGLEYNGEYIPEKVEEAARIILDRWNLEGILITLGEHGMYLMEKSGVSFKIPTMAQEVYDVSGAGDTVAGVFTSALSCGATLKEAAFISNMAAGIVVGKVGTAVATGKELVEALKNISN
jgi:D-beta-D-heptose 7-phosphate kinase/D-beta-D-heptose 1-phosphate adenosyltransferase